MFRLSAQIKFICLLLAGVCLSLTSCKRSGAARVSSGESREAWDAAAGDIGGMARVQAAEVVIREKIPDEPEFAQTIDGLEDLIRLSEAQQSESVGGKGNQYSYKVGDAAAAVIMQSTAKQRGGPALMARATRAASRFQNCYRFDGCANRIASLMRAAPAFADYLVDPQGAPTGVLQALVSHVRSDQTGITQAEPLLKELLETRLEIIRITAFLHRGTSSGFSAEGGLGFNPGTPGTAATASAIQNSASQVEQRIAAVTKGKRTAFSAVFIPAIKSHYERIAGGDTGLTGDDFENLAAMQFGAMAEAFVGAKALGKYAQRLAMVDWGGSQNQRGSSPEAWLSGLLNDLRPDTAWTVLVLFASYEIESAFGELWVQKAAEIHQKFFPDDQVKRGLLEAMQDQLKTRRERLSATVAKMEIPYADYLVANEAAVARSFPLFQSMTFQVNQLMARAAALSAVMTKLRDAGGESKLDAGTQERLDQAVADFDKIKLGISCYGFIHRFGTAMDYGDGNYKNLKERLKLASGKEFHPFDVCFARTFAQSDSNYSWFKNGSIQVRSRAEMGEYVAQLQRGNLSAEQNTNALVDRVRIEKIIAPVRLEIALQIATLPAIVISGGAAASTVRAASAGLSFAAKKIATAGALKIAESAVIKGAMVIGPRVASFVAEVALFSVYHRLATNALLTAYGAAVNDPNAYLLRKSMFDSYWHEIAFGIPIFAVLPRVGAISERLATRLVAGSGGSAAKLAGTRLIARDILSIAGDVAGQNIVFLAPGQAASAVERVSKGGPIFKALDTTELFKEILKGSYLALGFRGWHMLNARVAGNESLEVLLKDLPDSLPN